MNFTFTARLRGPRRQQTLFAVDRLLFYFGVVFLIGGLIGHGFDVVSRKRIVPMDYGTYTEGVVADSPAKVDDIITALTNVGLTYRESDNTIKPALAQSWTVSPDGKTYTFTLRQGYAASGLLATIQNSKNAWNTITISAPTSRQLQFVLTQPLNLFLSTTTVPLFPYGPYQVVKRTAREIDLRANTHFMLGEPHIQKITLKLYDSLTQLKTAAKAGEINGSVDFGLAGNAAGSTDDVPNSFAALPIDLPHYYVLFFNANRLKKLADRERVANSVDGPPVTYTLITSQTGPASELADSLAHDLAAKHITLRVQKKPSVTLQKEDIAKRDFDLLLYGIDYGVNHDYYPFWHSSQASPTGLNISGVKDKKLDQLLEQSRSVTNLADRARINQEIETFLQANALQKVLSQEHATFWLDSTVKGVKYGTIESVNDRFSLVWRWYIKTKKVK